MTRRPYQYLKTNEDRLIYRRWMRLIAFVYGSIAVLILGAAVIRLDHPSNLDTAKLSSVIDIIPISAAEDRPIRLGQGAQDKKPPVISPLAT
jgi:hypothetical protein